MPERFAPPALPKDRLIIAGAIRLENPAAYATFCEEFKKQNPVSTPSTDDEAASEAEPVTAAAEGGAAVAVKPKRVISDEQKAKMKAGREAAKAAKDAAIAAGQEPPKKVKKTKGE
jgi:hypothetical protein